jgi:hypothetical protein
VTRLASFCSGVLEVVNAVSVRLEDVVGEWVDGLAPRPVTTRGNSKRSRVQEAADRKWPKRKGTGWGADISAREETVLSVADWLRTESRRGFERNPDAIEREFLERR